MRWAAAAAAAVDTNNLGNVAASDTGTRSRCDGWKILQIHGKQIVCNCFFAVYIEGKRTNLFRGIILGNSLYIYIYIYTDRYERYCYLRKIHFNSQIQIWTMMKLGYCHVTYILRCNYPTSACINTIESKRVLLKAQLISSTSKFFFSNINLQK